MTPLAVLFLTRDGDTKDADLAAFSCQPFAWRSPGDLMTLNTSRSGDHDTTEQMFPVLYQELRAVAHRFMSGERGSHTLQATALVNEAYLRLVKQRKIEWQTDSQLLSVASQIMRRILVDHARAQQTQKRGGDQNHLLLCEDTSLGEEEQPIDILDLEEALQKLADLDERHCRIVELRFFAGLTINQTATVLGVAPRTVDAEWALAKSWLRSQLELGTTR